MIERRVTFVLYLAISIAFLLIATLNLVLTATLWIKAKRSEKTTTYLGEILVRELDGLKTAIWKQRIAARQSFVGIGNIIMKLQNKKLNKKPIFTGADELDINQAMKEEHIKMEEERKEQTKEALANKHGWEKK